MGGRRTDEEHIHFWKGLAHREQIIYCRIRQWPGSRSSRSETRIKRQSVRILLTSDSYPPLIGGATRAAQQIALAMRERGHQVEVITVWQPTLPTREQDGPVTVHRLRGLTHRIPGLSADPFRLGPPPYPDPELAWRIRRVVKSFQPDIVHAYGWLTYSLSVALLGTSIPVLLSARDYGNFCALRTLFRKNEVCSGPALGKCLECASSHYGHIKGTVATVGVLSGRSLLRHKLRGLHSCSGFVQKSVHKNMLNSNIINMPDAVLPDWRDPYDPDAIPDEAILARLPSEPFILFVGALSHVKGIRPLCEAYKLLRDPPPLVLIGGRTPDTPEIPRGVTVLKNVPHPTVMATWDQSLFGVFSSLWPEPLGNVIHEAMSRGKAVIGTRPGGHGEMIIEGENGFLVPSGDIGALAEAMQTLIDNDGLRTRMGARGYVLADRFAAKQIIPRFENLYADIVKSTHA
ncbi:MAG TPA: glycosyltransferase family 4 protein [Solirubrobacterales bacterium]|nr:glycosyltransferase family 4 protein [Solirubrobacterales bacterium]